MSGGHHDHGSDEAEPALHQRLDVPRSRAAVTQSRPELLDAGVQSVVEVDERVLGPEGASKLRAAHELAVALQEMLERPGRLRSEPHTPGIAPDVPRRAVELEHITVTE